MPSFKIIPPEDVAKARVLYETTSVSVHDIAKMLGIGTTTFMKRVKLWQWVPRNRRLAELDAAAKANVPVEKIRKLAARPKAVLDRAYAPESEDDEFPQSDEVLRSELLRKMDALIAGAEAGLSGEPDVG
jgi:DNA-directed RNA polymerase specialized sigma24 family protein